MWPATRLDPTTPREKNDRWRFEGRSGVRSANARKVSYIFFSRRSVTPINFWLTTKCFAKPEVSFVCLVFFCVKGDGGDSPGQLSELRRTSLSNSNPQLSGGRSEETGLSRALNRQSASERQHAEARGRVDLSNVAGNRSSMAESRERAINVPGLMRPNSNRKVGKVRCTWHDMRVFNFLNPNLMSLSLSLTLTLPYPYR